MRLVLALLLMCVAGAWALDAGPLERHMRQLKSNVGRLSARSFTTRYGNGAIHEKFTVTPDGYTYATFDPSGVKLVQWMKRRSGQIQYESWYTPNAPKERLLEDDRSISYTSFYKNGQKWEQYTYNKQKRVKSYDVYTKAGKLVGSP